MGFCHFIRGCRPGKILYRGVIEFQKGKREKTQIEEFTVHSCLKCGQPMIYKFWTQVNDEIKRRKKKGERPDSIPVAA